MIYREKKTIFEVDNVVYKRKGDKAEQDSYPTRHTVMLTMKEKKPVFEGVNVVPKRKVDKAKQDSYPTRHDYLL